MSSKTLSVPVGLNKAGFSVWLHSLRGEHHRVDAPHAKARPTGIDVHVSGASDSTRLSISAG